MKELLSLAKLAAVGAGSEILKHYDSFDIFSKKDKSPVTTADIAANEKIFEILNQSNIPICSEENIINTKSDIFWLVDPLDGTKEFIDKNGEFCVCIALIKDSRPIIGVIFIPTLNEIFYATKYGAFKESLSKKDKIKLNNGSQKVLYIGRRGKSANAKLIASKLGFSCVKMGSAIKFCKIAQLGGIYIRLSPNYIWDNAAGEAIVNFSGGLVVNPYTNSNLSYNLSELKSKHFISISREFINLKDDIVSLIQQQCQLP